MNRSQIRGAFVIGLAGLVAGCTSDERRPQPADVRDQRIMLNEGYSILYSHVSSLARFDLIFLVKSESEAVEEVTTAVTDYAAALRTRLEGVSKDYPAVKIDLDPVPEIEKRTRDAVTKDRLLSVAPVVGLTGESFDRRMLQSQEGMLNQLRFMAKALADEEPDPGLKQIWADAHVQFERLYTRVLTLLREQYYINTGERKVAK
jgi:hypothetical protein